MALKDLTPARLEAFSDGVIAIIITIMVLELKVPHGPLPADLWGQWPVFMSYGLSYLMVAIYWLNHHHLFRYVHKLDNVTLWANMVLLFFLSLVPFVTAYMGENHMEPFPTVLYMAGLFMAGVSFMVLIVASARAMKGDADGECFARCAIIKNSLALAIYAAGFVTAFYSPAIALCMAFIVSLMYFLPNAWLEKD